MAKRKTKPRSRKASAREESSFNFRMPAVVRANPADSAGLLVIGAAAAAVIVNALLLQDSAKPLKGTPVPRPALSASVPVSPVITPSLADKPNMLVREVQAELARRGLYDGPTDGLFGPKTEAAIFDFEMGAGLKPTGKPNPELLTAMRGGTPAAVIPSSQVAAVQRVLDQRGFGPIKADGILGEGTRTAIRKFEASRGLPQRGDISPALLGELTRVSGVKFN